MNKLIQVALLGVALSQLPGCASTSGSGDSRGALSPRTFGVFIGDQEIEFRAQSRLREGFPDKANNISATSYNRQVLLTGQVPDAAARARATEIVRGIPEVREVFNELNVSGVVSLTSVSNDTSITSKVKTRLLRSDKVQGTKVKVVTESAVVYLMGLITREEAQAAAEVARTTAGVTKVVLLFEYLN
ncbi:MAG: BON domain-containing protein [Thiobacillus sp.]